MIIIKCSKCNKKIFKYLKLGRGHLLRCWKDRILEDMSIINENNVMCSCGNIIGRDEKDYLKLNKNSIIIKGLKL